MIGRLQSISSHLSNSKQTYPTISFIGGGNMSEAIMAGLKTSGHPGNKIRYSEPFDQRRQYMESKYPELVSSQDNLSILEGADVIILAVKPQVLKSVIEASSKTILEKAPTSLIISIAAGITTQDIYKWMNTSQPVNLVRCMPNTPSLIGEGAFGLYATPHVNQEQRQMTESIMRAVAKQVLWVDGENLIDSVTGVSGSGPAYFFLIMEALRKYLSFYSKKKKKKKGGYEDF